MHFHILEYLMMVEYFPAAGLQDDIRKVDETQIDLTNK